MATSWTTDDLTALESAIKEGAKRVRYKDKEIEYRDLDEMFLLRDKMKRELGLGATSSRLKTNFSKGLDCEN